ncbi:anthranilate synthase TRP2 [Sugiyamaella lignohabitans]|uniref:anthranilate synthase n=1 Tax=Sugiyamaella lignohabitans TaxID=796027 RepID=A0A167DF67_9ASCO|nr:anthranilate synthase TRP2 [Sugiyamaella lignohabitans]ANB12849.1 anthranilate synthase TRP2 [Sugiyamaella lignohabitans]
MAIELQPSLDGLKASIKADEDVARQQQSTEESPLPPNTYPVFSFILADALTPHQAYLKLARPGDKARPPTASFLFESAIGGEKLDRYSFIGVNPRKILKTGNGFGPDVDPLTELENELKPYRQAKKDSVLPNLSGGAVGYISYDCIKYFEPRTKRDLADPLGVPESALMLFDTIVAFDNVFQRIQVIHNIHIPDDQRDSFDIAKAYNDSFAIISDVITKLQSTDDFQPPQPKVTPNDIYKSNIGQEGYEGHVTALKEHILKGDIFQAVPSQRVAHPTDLHAFNIYRHLRTVNPSPYLFYVDFIDFQIVGASPELLVKSDKGRIITHPIAGTVKRGKTADEDDQLAATLLSSQKDRAEHVMLVDLARNDINRVCDPVSSSVDRLMTVERFSHVIHLVSQVSGVLRPDKTRFDAFRSVFPAGTVSGAPKVRAMELIGELEKERRGVYAGAVGHWGYESESMDTCIALRTMLVKDGTAYLQAGGGIVYNSDSYDEYIETINKMRANRHCLEEAERIWAAKTASS